MTYKCPRCSTRVKDLSGDDPICGFDENGNFIENNWNCVTLNAFRKVGEAFYRYRVSDEHNMTIVSRCDVGQGVLSWYKDRGHTDDFRNGRFEKGTLRFAQELLGDVEPDLGDKK